ncbi:MAG TPA: polysaccharide biosynthesis C-terminal domain-containing protein [Bacteroidia bacterium]|jgi:O-antigen/teichoic acid export membrane protein|nr:polysaccharide biosynthesis C-terminal domain-containing protein [Bacteroidia bacterium]
MFGKIIQTIFSKGIISIINFLMVVLTAQYLGAGGRGEISMLFLNITVILLFNDIIGGSSLVYLTSKRNPYTLFLPAMAVGLFTGIVFPFLFNLHFNFPKTELVYFLLLTLLSNFSSICNYFLNGFEKIKQNNIANILQSVVTVASLALQLLVLKDFSVYSYYRALGLGYLTNLLISAWGLRGLFKPVSFSWKESIRVIASYGLIGQAGNIFQLLNYRFCYYVLDGMNDEHSKQNVGVFSTAASVSEAVWVIMNGIAMVQYATLSNRNNPQLAINITLKLSKISFALSVFALLVLNILPVEVFTFLFGPDFAEMKNYCLLLSPGIATAGLTGIYSHYFAARGDMKTSASGALVGLIITFGCSVFFIPVYGAKGAALTNCASYIASSVFLIAMFKIQSKTSLYSMFFSWKNLFPLTGKS